MLWLGSGVVSLSPRISPLTMGRPELAGEGRVEFRAEAADAAHVAHLDPDGGLLADNVEVAVLGEVLAVEGLVLASPRARVV